MTKIQIKPAFLIGSCLLLSLAAWFVPDTKIQYQVSVNPASPATVPTVITQEGYTRASDTDEYGRSVIPCRDPKVQPLPGAGYGRYRSIWALITQLLILAPMFAFVMTYFEAHRPPVGKFLIWAIGFGIAIILIPWVSARIYPEPDRPLCNQNDMYTVLSLAPNWTWLLLPAAATLLGYLGTRPNPQRDLIGQWKITNSGSWDEVTLTFGDQGTMSMRRGWQGEDVIGNYSFTSPNSIAFRLPDQEGTAAIKFNSATDMTLTIQGSATPMEGVHAAKRTWN